MTLKQTAKRYAAVLYNIAENTGTLDEVQQALITINELIRTESQFRSFLQSRRILGEQKTVILNTVMGADGHPLVSELVSYLSGSQATKILRVVADIFDHRYKEGKNIVSVTGFVASELGDHEITSLKSSLDEILGKKTDLSLDVDESLLGGIRLRIENTFLDASVQNQLQTLRRELVQS